jgi:hypothetical protein
MANQLSMTMLYGCHHFQPAQVSSSTCSWKMAQMSEVSGGYQKNVSLNIPSSGGDRVTIDLADLSAIEAQNLQDRHITKCHLYQYKCKINESPDVPLFMHETGNAEVGSNGQEGKWRFRISMFFTAFKCKTLFAISIVPKNPTVMQTWYLKKACLHDPLYDICVSSVSATHGEEIHDGTTVRNAQAEDFKGGFIKPFQAYYTNNYRPTVDLTNLPQLVQVEPIFDNQDLTGIVATYPVSSQNSIHSILSDFIQDTEATHLGLLTLNPQQQRTEQRIFMKTNND